MIRFLDTGTFSICLGFRQDSITWLNIEDLILTADFGIENLLADVLVSENAVAAPAAAVVAAPAVATTTGSFMAQEILHLSYLYMLYFTKLFSQKLEPKRAIP